MRRLFAAEEADVRPTLLGIVTLMFMLLFFLLSTSSGQRLGVVDLRTAAPGEAAPLPHTGLVHAIRVYAGTAGHRVEFEVSSTDIAASADTRELRAIDAPDLGALAAAIGEIHDIDPTQTRATVIVDDALSTDALMRVLDVVRGPTAAPRFPKVALR
jgi:hypothetical protein